MNYYLTGIEGIPKMLDFTENPLEYFKRKTYAGAFQKMYQGCVPTLDAIENGYKMVIDKDQFLENMANALVEHAAEKVNGCRRKSEKERMMLDLNMIMVVFVLPATLEYHGDSSRPLADKMVEGWKKQFPKTNIKAEEFAFIEKGFHKKFCYITTAVCETFSRPDDCYELTVLRDYRDHYMASLPEGEKLIQMYYDVAPTIVKHINQRESSREIYRSIWEKYLAPCIEMIEEGRLEECRKRYEDMVWTLQKEYFYQ